MGASQISETSLYYVVTILGYSLVFQPNFRANADILVQPISQTIYQGENGTVLCQVNGIGGWRINGTTVVPSNQASFQSRGFTVVINESNDGYYNAEVFTTLTMIVEGRFQNNNTRFVCYSVSDDGTVSMSNTVYLMVAGHPLPPKPTLLIPNSTTIQVSWEKPFTMYGGADILFYIIRMYNSSSQGRNEWTIYPLLQANTYAHNVSMKDIAKECILLTFEVSAINKAGSSPAGTVSGGFPIVPRATVINPIKAILEMSVTGRLMADVLLWPPQVCPYQEAIYSIAVKAIPGGQIVQSDKLFPSPINQNQSISIVVDGLQSNMSYQFTSMVQSVTGEVMFSTMAAYTTGDVDDGTAHLVGCITVFTESLLTIFCTSSDAISYNCSIDGNPPQPCKSPMKIMLTLLPPGQHVFEILGHTAQWQTIVRTIQFVVNPLQIACEGHAENGLLIVQCTSNRPISSLMCSVDGGRTGSCYTPLRLAEYSNRGHLLSVQGYSEDGQMSVTSLNFTGTLEESTQNVTFIYDSPILLGRNLTVFVKANKPYDSVMCKVDMLGTDIPYQDCSSGTAVFDNLPEGEAVVRLSAKIGGNETAATKNTVWIYDDPEFCAPYLVNDMITIENDVARVTFGSSGRPSGYSCSVDSGKLFPCTSPTSLASLSKGKHFLQVRPEQCNSYQTSSFSFEI